MYEVTDLCCVGSQSYKDYDCCFGWTRWFAELQNDSITDIVTFKISLFHYQIPPDMTSSWGNWFLNAERESDRNYSSLRRVSIRYLPINILTTYLPYGTEGRGGWMSITFFFIHCTVYMLIGKYHTFFQFENLPYLQFVASDNRKFWYYLHRYLICNHPAPLHLAQVLDLKTMKVEFKWFIILSSSCPVVPRSGHTGSRLINWQ